MNNYIEFEEMAKLSLTDGERASVEAIADMLTASFGEMADVETDNVRPLVSTLEIMNRMREDVCVKAISREELLSYSPEQYDGYVQAPKTVSQ